MRPDHRLSPRVRFEACIIHLFGKTEPKPKPKRRKRPPCNSWGKRH